MALSISFQKDQVPMSCEMCEESNEIKWKCYQCDFLLCTKCEKLHKKVKSVDQHTIIDITQIASHQEHVLSKLDFSNIPCKIHRGKKCCSFCKSCEQVICLLCITKNHNQHDMIKLTEGYELTLKSVNTLISKIDLKLVQNVKVLSVLGNFKSSESTEYELEKQKILSRGNILKDEVGKHANTILKELNKKREILVKSMNHAENTTEKTIIDLKQKEENINNALNSNNVNQVISMYSEEKTSRQQIKDPTSTMFKKLPKFVPGRKHVIPNFFLGALTETNNLQKLFKFKVIKQYKTELALVENLLCCNDAAVRISYFYSHYLQKVELSNGSLHTTQIYGNGIISMALLPSGDILVSDMESSLKILPYSTSKVKPTKYDVYPFVTLAVHVTSDHRIVVGARENQPNSFPVIGARQVIMMNMDGKQEKVYRTDNEGKPIFTVPYRITTDNDNNIYVIDVINKDWSGRILALDKTNGVKWTYSGHPYINTKQTFKPRDLVVSNFDNIITTDSTVHMIYIVNTSGQCIHHLNTEDLLGIELPFSVEIDNSGTLYLGCSTYKGEREEAKIYTIQVPTL
ncbi:unnamed protein product [Mytilus coruscus]|uniref:B box-type domain-containing protein n=1 Tax=Mytilus coruscus TaxID=42192 RepID=A0A6J8EEC8_MYTCO|nr:unnamed protein product [Mytilus coruscus]